MQRKDAMQATTRNVGGPTWIRTPEERETFESLGITNAAVFALVMMRNPDLCRRVIEASIGRKVDEVEVVTTEKTIMVGIGAKGVRLDALAYAGGEAFDVEMQVGGSDGVARRTRYYHAAMDIELLGRGNDYALLPNAYVIFIGATSLLGAGFEPVPARTFRMTDEETGRPLGDGAVTVILDATAWEAADGELRGMLELVRKGDEADALADEAGIAAALQGAVEQAKESEGDTMIMSAATQMELMERAIESGRQELSRTTEVLTRTTEELTRKNEELTRKDEEITRKDEELELIKALLNDKRYEEAERAADDPELRARLLREYEIRAE